jgi:hypothetical protein
MVNAKDLKSFTIKGVRVRVPPPTPRYIQHGKALTDYILIVIGREQLLSCEIYDRLHQSYGYVHLRTFYRRLNWLVKQGKVLSTKSYCNRIYRLSKTVRVRQ